MHHDHPTAAPEADQDADRAADLAPGIGTAPVRVALLADTHGWVDPRVLTVVAGCDLAVHGGDIGGARVLRRLRPRLGRLWVVRGNNDRPIEWPAADQAALEQIPSWARVALPIRWVIRLLSPLVAVVRLVVGLMMRCSSSVLPSSLRQPLRLGSSSGWAGCGSLPGERNQIHPIRDLERRGTGCVSLGVSGQRNYIVRFKALDG